MSSERKIDLDTTVILTENLGAMDYNKLKFRVGMLDPDGAFNMEPELFFKVDDDENEADIMICLDSISALLLKKYIEVYLEIYPPINSNK